MGKKKKKRKCEKRKIEQQKGCSLGKNDLRWVRAVRMRPGRESSN